MRKYIINNLFIFILLVPQICFGDATGQVIGGAATTVAGNAATGAATSAAAKAAVQAAGPAVGKLSESIGTFLSNPPGILIVSAIGTANSALLYSAADDQEKEAEENVKRIEKIIATYKDSWLAYCPNGREDLNEPNCYCYTEAGAENSSRSKSQTCVDLWAKNKYKIVANAANYKGTSKFVDPVGCMNLSGQFDEACKCKKFISSNGSNSCMKSVTLNTGDNQLGMAYLKNSGFDNVTKALTSQTSGLSNLSATNSKLLANAVAKQGDMNNPIFTKIMNDPEKKDFKVFDNNIELQKFQNAILPKSALVAAAAAFGSSPSNIVQDSRPTGNLNNVLKEAANKAGLDLGGGHGLQNKKTNLKDAMSFNFSGDSAGSSTQTQNFPEKEKNYNYKNNDISKKTDESIFNIISNRYIQSGLKRLFEN